jgi:hypothetical protein
MRPTPPVGGAKPHHGYRGEPGPRLALGKLHGEDITSFLPGRGFR